MADPMAMEKVIVPFSSEAQKRFMWAKHPRIAEAWAHGKSSVTGKKEPAGQRGRRKRK
jgi:hypothetical protein